MESYIFEGVMTALSSIAHSGGQSFGINTKLRREKFVQPDGNVEEIPVISGNGLRGMLRDRGMLHMCRLLGYGVNDLNGTVQGLTLPAFHFLFSGGTLTGDGNRALDIELARRLRTLIPLVGVFGGAVGNQILPGRLKMGKAIPICAETAHLLPERYTAGGISSIWDYLQEEMYTRKDDEKNEFLRQLMSPQTLQLMDAKRAAGKARNEAGDADPDVGAHQQMMYYVETFAAGTHFYWELILDDPTEIEFEALVAALVEWSKLPYVGGKSNVGLGKVAITFDKWLKIEPRLNLAETGREIGLPMGNKYLAHLREQGPAIRAELERMR
jgi:CRISPR type IV-associated protein Csf2